MKIAIEAFERASIEELSEGVMEDPETHEWVCMPCGKTFAPEETE